MKTAQDYLAEKVQELENSKKFAEFSCNYWMEKAISYMREKGMNNKEIQGELVRATKDMVKI